VTHVDVRIVAATNKDLRAMCAERTFREDLYFRLNVLEIPLPPLAGRGDDIDALADHFVAELGGDAGPRTLSSAARRALHRHDWPGNVRELRNRVQRAVVVAEGAEIGVRDLDLEGPTPAGSPAGGSLGETGGDDVERQRIEDVLVACSGVVARAAEALGMSRQALYRRMERLGITVSRRIGD
jgi:DNA-binding NtrC family response regulator